MAAAVAAGARRVGRRALIGHHILFIRVGQRCAALGEYATGVRRESAVVVRHGGAVIGVSAEPPSQAMYTRLETLVLSSTPSKFHMLAFFLLEMPGQVLECGWLPFLAKPGGCWACGRS